MTASSLRLRRLLPLLLALLLLPAGASPAAGSVKGTWSGSARVTKGDQPGFKVRMTITRLRTGQRAGTLSYPGTPCRGSVRLRGRRDGGYSFRYRESSGAAQCTNDDSIFVRRVDGRLSWRARARGGQLVARATLRRV